MIGLQDEFVLVAPDGRRIVLSQGLFIYVNLFNGVYMVNGNTPFAQVSVNPNNPAILGLTNLSAYEWEVNIPGKGVVRISNGRSVRLEHGLALIIGPYRFRVERNGMPNRGMVQYGWILRITNGNNAGREFILNKGIHYIGSGAPSDIVIFDPHIAAKQMELNVRNNQVIITNLVYGGVISTNKGVFQTTALGPGDSFMINGISFMLLNPALTQARMNPAPWQNIKWNYKTIGVAMSGMALAFVLLYLMTGVTNIIPALLLIVSSVVPLTAIAYLVEKYDKTGISFRTLTGSFLLGGTVGILAAIFFEWTADVMLGGLLPLAILAGVIEEPAKLITTFWRWKHPLYDRPMDGLIIGTVCGFGFAVFETAGYGLTSLLHGGVGDLLVTLAVRSFLTPFGHGIWTGITGAAFWECDRDVTKAMKDKRFQKALMVAIGLHVLWDSGMIFGNVLFPLIISASISALYFNNLLHRQGYSV